MRQKDAELKNKIEEIKKNQENEQKMKKISN